jgi:muramoyltetrapeptide carboxypeptidase
MDPQVDMIIATTGGYNSNEILEFLDLSFFVPSEKFFVGYSDCTALSMAFERYNICKTVCGPMLIDYVDFPDCFERLFSVLTGVSYELSNDQEVWESSESGRFQMARMRRLSKKVSSSVGIALAANLSTLCLMMGTPFLPSFEGRTLFLEYDREEQRALPSLERLLWQLRQGGILQNLAGLVFGALQPSVAAEETATDYIERILSEVTDGYVYPVIYNAQFGHMYPSWVIVNGREVWVHENGTLICL